MRLVALTSNKATFHPVRFNPSGPSYVFARQKPREQGEQPDSHTYNGVGKSLLLYLVNYCLGADSKESFNAQLEGWEFSLTMNLRGREVVATRVVSCPDVVRFDGEDMSLTVYRDRLEDVVFPQVRSAKFLTFRTIIGQFLRPGKIAYTHFDRIHMSEKPVQKLMRSAYLLGLDIALVQQKHELREEVKKMSETRFKNDPIIREYFQGKKDVNLDIKDLRDQLDALEAKLAGFKVAENYHEVEREAGRLKSQLQKIRNQAVTMDARLRQMDESLAAKPEVSVQMVRDMYSAAKIQFSDRLVRSLTELETFHTELLQARQTRLKKERQQLHQRLATTEKRLVELGVDLDKQLKFLGDHGALSELLLLSERANEVRSRWQKLVDFKGLSKQYRDRTRELNLQLAEANVAAAKYLDQNEKKVEEAAEMFRTITRRMYPDKSSGLTVENDDGDNTTRFKIEARILSDSSDGINEAKIFAYDIMVAALRRNHAVRFICHDSRLYPDIDPRQRSELFVIAHEYSTSYDFQYIATVNQDHVDPVQERLGSEKFKAIFQDAIVLELNDDTPGDRLLGVEIDLDYD